MRVASAILFGFLLGIASASAGEGESIDPFCFLAGLCTTGADMGYIAPPQCESFFREGGEQRVAELFLEVAKTWSKKASPATTFRYYESGGRLIVEHQGLSEALLGFYAPSKTLDTPSVASIDHDPSKRLSFLAGIYARCFRDGGFHSRPSDAMRMTVKILRLEGCQVSEVTYRNDTVPNTMHFQVTPSERVARVFALVDKWQPNPVKWEHVEWKPQ